MLNNVLKGIEASSSILIQDSLSCSGASLLRTFIQEKGANNQSTTHILCFEHSPNSIKKQLKSGFSLDGVIFYDHCTDCRGWNGRSTVEEGTELSSVVVTTSVKNIVIVYSLSNLILRIGLPKTYRQLHSMIESGATLICLVHEDLLPDSVGTLITLQHLFATRFQLLPSENPNNTIAESVHVKKGGKIIRSYEEFSVDSQNDLTVYETITKKKIKDFKPVVLQVPKDITTFKMDLGESEKVARNKLVLPYLRPEAESSAAAGGKVFYELDEADDWDEEDPDDDLDV